MTDTIRFTVYSRNVRAASRTLASVHSKHYKPLIKSLIRETWYTNARIITVGGVNSYDILRIQLNLNNFANGTSAPMR